MAYGDLGGMMAFLGAYLVVVAAFYVYGALALMTIAKRTKTPNAWFAWIPVLNLYLITQIAGVPWWTLFAFVLGVIPIIGTLLVIGVSVWWFWKVAEARGKPGWWGILMLVPVVNLIILGILAWGE